MSTRASDEGNFKVVIRVRPPLERELSSDSYLENTVVGPKGRSIQIKDYFNYIPGSFFKKSKIRDMSGLSNYFGSWVKANAESDVVLDFRDL